jgi:hypothetical protein
MYQSTLVNQYAELKPTDYPSPKEQITSVSRYPLQQKVVIQQPRRPGIPSHHYNNVKYQPVA